MCKHIRVHSLIEKKNAQNIISILSHRAYIYIYIIESEYENKNKSKNKSSKSIYKLVESVQIGNTIFHIA